MKTEANQRRSNWTKDYWRKLRADKERYARFTKKKRAGTKAAFLRRREKGLFSRKKKQ